MHVALFTMGIEYNIQYERTCIWNLRWENLSVPVYIFAGIYSIYDHYNGCKMSVGKISFKIWFRVQNFKETLNRGRERERERCPKCETDSNGAQENDVVLALNELRDVFWIPLHSDPEICTEENRTTILMWEKEVECGMD